MIRPADQGIIGFPTYYHQRIAQDIFDTGQLPAMDELSFGGRMYLYPPAFHILLASFAIVFGMFSAGVIMLAIFGAFAVIFTYLIAKEMFQDLKAARIAAVLVALMPATIFAFTHLCSRAPPIALGLVSLYLLMREDRHAYISMMLIGISAWFHLETALIFTVLAVPLLHKIWKETDFKIKVIGPVLVVVIIAGAFYVPFFAQNGFVEYNAIHDDYRSLGYSMQSAGADEYFIELSPYASASIIAIVFAIIGFLFMPQLKYANYIKFWIFFIFILTLVFERFLIYMAVPLAIMAVIGLSVVYNKTPRKLFSIILIGLLLWSVAGASIKLNQMTNEYPSASHFQSMLWIKQNTPADAIIVSDWSYGHWIASIAQRRNYMDGYAEYAPQINERHAQLQELYIDFRIPNILVNEKNVYLYVEKWILEKYHDISEYPWDLVYQKDEIYVFRIK